jgi:hypothetical protein
MRGKKIPTLLGLLLLVLGLGTGLVLVQRKQIFKPKASPTSAPQDIRVTNITDSSFTISWVTDQKTSGFVEWGKSPNSLTRTKLDEIGDQSSTHSVNIQNLSPSTTYYFKINSGGKRFDNNGSAWQITTGPKIPKPAISNLLSGRVVTSEGKPVKNALVYLNLTGVSPLSTITSENGSWVISISEARTPDLTSLADIDDDTTLTQIFVQADAVNKATAQIYPRSAKPTPPIILGQNHDFRTLNPSESGGIPKPNINLPQESDQASKFDVPDQITPAKTETVTLESIKEGEIVSTNEPEFFGEGPPKTTMTIILESNPITDQITIDSFGNWKWNPPTSLSEGVHKITITWRDANGILRTLTRNFIVQASEEPAFEATPSATPTSTPTPTPTPTPSATPSASPTAVEIPDSGNLTPTFILSIMGLGLIGISIIILHFAF